MDLKQIINQVADIHNGFKNKLLKEVGVLDDKIIAEGVRRENICVKCPLLKDLKCDTSKEIEVVADFINYGKKFKKGDKVKGCGCNLNLKWLSEESKCPANKWQLTDNQ